MSAVAESAMIWKLKSVSAITSLLGKTGTGTPAIYPRIAPQDSQRPYIVVDRPPGEVRPQISGQPALLNKTPLVVYCVADNYQASRSIGAQVAAAMIPSGGWTGSATWNSTTIDHAIVTSTYDASKPPQVGDEVGWPVEAVEIDLYYLNCGY